MKTVKLVLLALFMAMFTFTESAKALQWAGYIQGLGSVAPSTYTIYQYTPGYGTNDLTWGPPFTRKCGDLPYLNDGTVTSNYVDIAFVGNPVQNKTKVAYNELDFMPTGSNTWYFWETYDLYLAPYSQLTSRGGSVPVYPTTGQWVVSDWWSNMVAVYETGKRLYIGYTPPPNPPHPPKPEVQTVKPASSYEYVAEQYVDSDLGTVTEGWTQGVGGKDFCYMDYYYDIHYITLGLPNVVTNDTQMCYGWYTDDAGNQYGAYGVLPSGYQWGQWGFDLIFTDTGSGYSNPSLVLDDNGNLPLISKGVGSLAIGKPL